MITVYYHKSSVYKITHKVINASFFATNEIWMSVFYFRTHFCIVVVVLCLLVDQDPYRIAKGFKAKWEVSCEARAMHNESASVDRWKHRSSPPHQFWFVFKGREISSLDNTHRKLIDRGTFDTLDFTSRYTARTRWIFRGIWIQIRRNIYIYM